MKQLLSAWFVWMMLGVGWAAYGQVNSPRLAFVPTAPSGACAATAPLQFVTAGAQRGNLYGCNSSGMWAAIGGTSASSCGSAMATEILVGNTCAGDSGLTWASGNLTSTGTTNDGSTNILTLRDSDAVAVLAIDTNGNIIAPSAGLTWGGLLGLILTGTTDSGATNVLTLHDSGSAEVLTIDTNGVVTGAAYTGVGTAYACWDASGVLVRSGVACI